MNENQYDYDSYGQMKRKTKRNGGFGAGIAVGAVSGFFLAVFFGVLIVSRFVSAGYIHIATDGTVYVQETAVNADTGIGSAVEEKLNTIDSLLDSFYMDDADAETAADNIYKAYLASYGDKYTVYYTAEEYDKLMESTLGTFYGIGAVCQKNDDGSIQITQVYKDAPADKAGLKEKDSIVKVDGEDITDMDLSSAVALIKGDKGTSVNLEIIRDGQQLSIDVVRDKIEMKTVDYYLRDDNIGYIQVAEFDSVTTEQFKAAVEDLEAQGMTGLIIDIRDNPGGLLSTVKDMLEYILPDGLLVYTEDKNGKRVEYKGSDNNELTVPLAVLVNGNSASASEIFAGAVQDYEKGAIIGTQTFGKGIVQTIQPLSDGSAIKFTISQYYTPNGQVIHGKGVTPDEVVELSEDAAEDTQLEAAVNYIKSR